MLYIFCSRKRETVSYLQYIYVLNVVYHKDVSHMQYLYYIDILNKKEGNCIKPTVCLLSRLCLSERGKLYHAYNMFMFCILCLRNRETVSYTHHVYDIAYQKEGNCVIPTLCLCSRFFASERGELYHTYNICML